MTRPVLSRYFVSFAVSGGGQELRNLWLVASDDAEAFAEAERYGLHHDLEIEANMRGGTVVITVERKGKAEPAGYAAGFNAALAWVLERFNLDTEDEDALREAIENGPWE